MKSLVIITNKFLILKNAIQYLKKTLAYKK